MTRVQSFCAVTLTEIKRGLPVEILVSEETTPYYRVPTMAKFSTH